MSRVQRSRVVSRGVPAPPIFLHVPYPHLELNKDGTSYFIRCGLPMPRWYRPELLVGPARAAAPVVPNPAAREYRTAYAVHSEALPIAATPALPALPGPTSAGVPMAPGPTRCVQQLTWTPSVVVVEPGASARIVAMALHPLGPAAPAARDGGSAPGPQQPRPEPVAQATWGAHRRKERLKSSPCPRLWQPMKVVTGMCDLPPRCKRRAARGCRSYTGRLVMPLT